MSAPAKTCKPHFLLYPQQADFLNSRALFRGFTGGRGTGKSFCGAYDILHRAKPGRLYLIAAPTFPMLKDASLRSFLAVAEQAGIALNINRSDMRAVLWNGAEFLFRSADDPERLRGPNLSGAWLDEASLMKREAFDIAIACLREQGEQGFLTATFTPRGKLHWTYELFGTGRADTSLTRARTLDNPFLPAEFYATIKAQYGSILAAQELEGEFIEGGGSLFQRQWFEIVEVAPLELRKVRYWDLAATEPKDGNDPDYTVGLLMGRSPAGVFYVLDVRRTRATPKSVEALVKQTAELDGPHIPIYLEQEPGSSGVNVVDYYTRLLAGYAFHGDKVTGDKFTRANPLSSQAEAGNVKLLRGPWNKDLLDEVESFPSSGHDDQIDGLSGAFGKLALPTAFRKLQLW